MRSFCIFLMLTMFCGCANVAGNYPTMSIGTAQAQQLPTKWEWRDHSQPVLWEKPGHSKAFFAQWDDLKIALAKAEYAADKGSAVAARDARDIKALVQRKLCIARVALFYIADQPLPLKQGDVQLTFSNGDVVQDSGVLFWEMERADSDKHSSRSGTIHIDKTLRKQGEPLLLRILVPEQYLNMDISSIAFPTP